MSNGNTAALEAWRDACARLAALGEEVFAEPYPTADADQADAAAHLVQQVVCWMNWSVWHADPRRPFFHRQNDLITQWGGPNADNIYRHARIDTSRRYRIRGRMNSCEEWVLAIRCGFMHQPKWGTVHEAYASDFGIGAGESFELILGGDPMPGVNWVPLPDGAIMASFREYYFDWVAADPAFLTIECLDDDVDEPAPRLTQEDVSARIADAVAGVEHSVRNWNSYLNEHRAGATDNVMAAPHKVTKGLAAARYAFCFWNLAPDEALVLETTVPDARYWSFQLYEMGTYELVDMVEHQSSLNHKQVTVDPDGKVRVVLAHSDPGVANWLDTANRPVGQFTYRFFWAAGDPTFHTRVVKLADLDTQLPDTARVTPDERAAQLAARRAHFAFRYRT
jgi:hypothetical protein